MFISAWHPEWDSVAFSAPPAQREDETFIQQMAALNIDPAQVMPADSAERLGTSDYELENRFVSNTLAAVSQFNAALLAAPSVTPQQRHDSALARLKLFYGANITAVADILNSFPADADADLFAYYLPASPTSTAAITPPRPTISPCCWRVSSPG
jgi:hypothetical protein